MRAVFARARVDRNPGVRFEQRGDALAGAGTVLERSGEAPAELSSHQSQYRYLGIDTCAATGMCATRCPVSAAWSL